MTITPKEMVEMQRNMPNEVKDRALELYEAIKGSIEETQKYAMMTNKELAKELMELWAEIPIFSKQSTLLERIMFRLSHDEEE